jgi:hypothetical protein
LAVTALYGEGAARVQAAREILDRGYGMKTSFPAGGHSVDVLFLDENIHAALLKGFDVLEEVAGGSA